MRRSRQSKWQRTPQNVNWRGARPKFNPTPEPETAMSPVRLIDYYQAAKNDLKFTDAKGNPVSTLKNIPPRVLAQIKREQLIFDQSEYGLRIRLEARMRSLLEGD